MSGRRMKPGYMKRAVAAWCILNATMILMLIFIVWLVGPWLDRWYTMVPLLIGVIITEMVIMSETVAPIMRDWIRQEEETIE